MQKLHFRTAKVNIGLSGGSVRCWGTTLVSQEYVIERMFDVCPTTVPKWGLNDTFFARIAVRKAGFSCLNVTKSGFQLAPAEALQARSAQAERNSHSAHEQK